MQHNHDSLITEINSFLETIAPSAGGADDRKGFLQHALRLKPALLAKAFNQAAVPPVLRDLDPHKQPALELAAQNNLTSIGTAYVLPPGLTALDIEAYTLAVRWATQQGRLTLQRYTERLGKLCDALEELNPSLGALTHDRRNPAALFDVAMGVTSGFNPDDIQFYLDGNYHYIAVSNPAYAQLLDRAEKQVVGHLGWVPSPQTLKQIITQTRKP